MSHEFFFSKFCYRYWKKSNNLKELPSKFDVEESEEKTFDRLLWYWIREFRTLYTKPTVRSDLKNHLMQDFLDTLYLHEKSFDIINLVLVLPCAQELSWLPSCSNEIFWEILNFASITGRKYTNIRNGTLEKPIDFPIQEDNMYGCAECMRPLQYAASNGYPYAVHRLLNLGACVRDDEACDCPRSIDTHPILRLINVPGCCTKYIERSDPGAYEGAVACYNMILADTPYYTKTWRRINEALQRYSNIAVGNNIPGLKYIVRLHIRKILKYNNNICNPNVWETLGLPDLLISYMEINGYVYDADGLEVTDKYRPHVLV